VEALCCFAEVQFPSNGQDIVQFAKRRKAAHIWATLQELLWPASGPLTNDHGLLIMLSMITAFVKP
jgi:hypothetical protein